MPREFHLQISMGMPIVPILFISVEEEEYDEEVPLEEEQ